MTTSAFTRPRQDAGTPAGGEFKAYGHSDAVPSLTGRRSAPATSNRHVPESLRMAHIQDPKLVSELDSAVERSLEDDTLADYHAVARRSAGPGVCTTSSSRKRIKSFQ